MAPGQMVPTNLSFAVARKILKPEDMERLACAFLNATDTVKVRTAALQITKLIANDMHSSTPRRPPPSLAT